MIEVLHRNTEEFAPGMGDFSFIKNLADGVVKKQKDLDTIIVKAEAHAIERAEGIFKDAEEEAQIRLGKLAEKELKVEAKMAKEWAERAPSLVAQLYAKTLAKEMTEADNNALIARMSA
jgi:F0F1-type ATP synthase membrane subunit b/b'